MKTAEELITNRYQTHFGDKWDRVAKLFDYYDMIDFAEAYASQPAVSEEESEEIKRLKADFLTLVFEPESNQADKIRLAASLSAPLGYIMNRRDPTLPRRY